MPVLELGSLLSELPRTRPGEGRRRSLREWAADRRAACNQPTAGPPDVVDRYRWRAGVTPRAVDPASRARLQDAVRALGEETEADRAELEQRALAYDDPGCPPDLFGPDELSLNDKLAADDLGGMTDRAAHAQEWRPAGWIEPTDPDRDWLERDDRRFPGRLWGLICCGRRPMLCAVRVRR